MDDQHKLHTTRDFGHSGGASRLPVLAVLTALIVGGVVGALVFGGNGSSSDRSTTSSTATPTVATSLRPKRYGSLGMSIAPPRGWRVTERSGVIRMLSPDQTVSLAVSAPQSAGHEVDLRRSDSQALQSLFKPARVLGRQRGKIAGAPALTTELSGVTPKHRPVRILSTAVSSAYRTYSVQVFTVPKPATARLLEIRNALGSMQFFAPVK